MVLAEQAASLHAIPSVTLTVRTYCVNKIMRLYSGMHIVYLTTRILVYSNGMKKRLKKNEELQSRREFFKRAAKGTLPVIGLVTFGPSILSSCGAGDDDEDIGGGSSKGCSDCTAQCQSSCKYLAATNPGTCRGTTCSNECKSACRTSCMGSCRGGSK